MINKNQRWQMVSLLKSLKNISILIVRIALIVLVSVILLINKGLW